LLAAQEALHTIGKPVATDLVAQLRRAHTGACALPCHCHGRPLLPPCPRCCCPTTPPPTRLPARPARFRPNASRCDNKSATGRRCTSAPANAKTPSAYVSPNSKRNCASCANNTSAVAPRHDHAPTNCPRPRLPARTATRRPPTPTRPLPKTPAAGPAANSAVPPDPAAATTVSCRPPRNSWLCLPTSNAVPSAASRSLTSPALTTPPSSKWTSRPTAGLSAAAAIAPPAPVACIRAS